MSQSDSTVKSQTTTLSDNEVDIWRALVKSDTHQFEFSGELLLLFLTL